MQDSLVGAVLRGYRIERLIGRGGMSRVYRAVQLELDRAVALKVLPNELAADGDFRSRFLNESRLAASLDHPNVIPIYDAGEDSGWLFIAMRLVEGSDLRSFIHEHGPLQRDRAVEIVSQVASALDVAHSRGLIHRDVKSANLLLDGRGHVYLTDFGIAKSALADVQLTQVRSFLGSLEYAAPEQIRREAVDERSDIYSLGCVLHELLTGAVPFDRPTEHGLMQAHLFDAVEALPPLVDPSGALHTAISVAMAKDPAQRFRSMGHFIEALHVGATGHRASERPTVIDRSPLQVVSPASVLAVPSPRPTEDQKGEPNPFLMLGIAIGLVLTVAVLSPRVAGTFGTAATESARPSAPISGGTPAAVAASTPTTTPTTPTPPPRSPVTSQPGPIVTSQPTPAGRTAAPTPREPTPTPRPVTTVRVAGTPDPATGFITVTWSGIPEGRTSDWIGVFAAGDGVDSRGRLVWVSTQGSDAGSATLGLATVPDGTYDVRIGRSDFVLLARSGSFKWPGVRTAIDESSLILASSDLPVFGYRLDEDRAVTWGSHDGWMRHWLASSPSLSGYWWINVRVFSVGSAQTARLYATYDDCSWNPVDPSGAQPTSAGQLSIGSVGDKAIGCQYIWPEWRVEAVGFSRRDVYVYVQVNPISTVSQLASQELLRSVSRAQVARIDRLLGQ